MKIFKSIIWLLAIVTSFFVNSQQIICDDNYKSLMLKPVFMNGMSNTYSSAIESSFLMMEVMQDELGSDIISNIKYPTESDRLNGTFYLALNEFNLFQPFHVVDQYLYSIQYEKWKLYTDEEHNRYQKEYKDAYNKTIDKKAIEHRDDIRKLIDLGYSFIITSHSQGNMYFNTLFKELLQYYPDVYKVVSLGSPVFIDGNEDSFKMLIEEDDFIKVFKALKNYSDNSNTYTNISNSNSLYKGHSVSYYFKGEETKKEISSYYSDFFNNLFPNYSKSVANSLKITINSDNSTTKYLIHEEEVSEDKFDENLKFVSNNLNSTYDESTIDDYYNSKTLNGNVEITDTGLIYTQTCPWLSYYEEGSVSIKAWTENGESASIETLYEGIYSGVMSDYISNLYPDIERYQDIGYKLSYKDLGGNLLDVDANPIYKYDDEIKVSVTHPVESFDFDVSITLYPRYKNLPYIYYYNVSENLYSNPLFKDNYANLTKKGKIEAIDDGYMFSINESIIPEGYYIGAIYFSVYGSSYPSWFTVNASMPNYDSRFIHKLGKKQAAQNFFSVGYISGGENFQYHYNF